MASTVKWPENRRFAFTIFDDTDRSTVENTSPIYSLMSDLGMRTTKSVWPLAQTQEVRIPGAACSDPQYLAFVRKLQQDGFEIGYHNARSHSSEREDCLKGLEEFQKMFGYEQVVMSQHARNFENMYWGPERLSGWKSAAYGFLTKNRRRPKFMGAVESSPYFWGDYSHSRVKYLRNFIFRDINTLKMCPWMPYHDPERPYVNYWYASSDGDIPPVFTELLSEKNQDQLEEEGGACVVFSHLAKGFQEKGKVLPRIETLLKRLAAKNGWFVPVGTLLDHLAEQGAGKDITAEQRTKLERQFLLDCVTRNVRRLAKR